jgi:formylglycine-generating enzyme required for sulfatase activity
VRELKKLAQSFEPRRGDCKKAKRDMMEEITVARRPASIVSAPVPVSRGSRRPTCLLALLIFAATGYGQTAATTATAGKTSERVPGSVSRDCPDCPEMVVIPAGKFTMGSSESDKSWAASHGGDLESVADESPQHVVSLRAFALGKYPVTRGEYAAFAQETKYPAGDGCGKDSFSSKKQAGVSWQNPGFGQTERDPVVCVGWQDARAYVYWLNGKVRHVASNLGNTPYRPSLPLILLSTDLARFWSFRGQEFYFHY